MAQRKSPQKKTPPDAEILRRQYHGERMTSSQLGRLYDVDPQTILNWMKRYGIDRRPVGSCPGDMNPSWKGGRVIDKNGYVLLHDPNHPNARKNGYVLEHRKVKAKEIGRPLDRKEVVHHKNTNKQDNDPQNLHLYQSNAEHLKDELTGQIPNWSEEGKDALYQAVRKPRRNTWNEQRRQEQRERLSQRRENGERFGLYEWDEGQREDARQRMLKRYQEQ